MRSQDTTDLRPVTFPFWMVQEIALDLAEKQRLEAAEQLTLLQLASYKSLVQELGGTGQLKSVQLGLLQKENRLLELQLKTEQDKQSKGNTFLWLLRLLGAVGAGYFLGHL